ncbi:hypothetical protein PAPYR_3209 [Paratrimastix pyriformis]|uniref:C3H1-type domain-containing protein n=1 Tax=Paratrimastix pyriformis TaxID=342808 RepID=A0ABQ8UV03_9EUKA|nr:hypothetical protein PAPYR_3209 [Paratrimastix pyriformis]
MATILQQGSPFSPAMRPRTPPQDISDIGTPTDKRTPVVGSKRKTELCRNWVELGHCPYGSRCQYAHGEEELRDSPHQRSKQKSKLCKAFHESGSCYYGCRCRFQHTTGLHSEMAFEFHHRLPVFDFLAPEEPGQFSPMLCPRTPPLSPDMSPSVSFIQSPPLSPLPPVSVAYNPIEDGFVLSP